MGRGLVTYRQKRDFSRTAEPEGGEPRASDRPSYVMHKHDASRLHFDLRLEQDGVLRSWALPKGPSLVPGEKRLAVEVEDHPLEYGEFEGVIPKGEYGGGTVMLWDHGYWELRGKAKADRLDFELHGEKLTGHWTLVRLPDKAHGKGSKPPKQHQWLMIRRSDDGEVPQPNDLSVKTGRSMAQIAKAEPATSKKPPSPQLPPQARERAMPESLEPQLATLVETPPKGKSWLHELKLDGYRLVAWLDQGRVTLRTRNGKDWTAKFQEVAAALSELPAKQALIDGEIVVPQADGSTSFRKLQDYLSTKGQKAAKPKLAYQAFDLLYLDGSDLRHAPLLDRKLALSQLTGAEASGLVRYCDHVVGQGDAFFEQVCQMGLEGMVSKKASAHYRGGRQQSWLKTKCRLQDEFIIVGYTPPSGSRKGFGSLLLASVDGSDLVYAGRVGTGFNSRQLIDLHRRLQRLEVDRSPFPTSPSAKIPDEREVQWVRPELVADVEFTERTRAGALRHPVFRGVREDKDITELAMSKGSGPKSTSSSPEVAGVTITHPDRELYPEHGIAKLDIANYYADVHEWILPHLVERPLALLRCPEGLEGECFFQKHADPHFAEKVPRVSVPEKQGGKTEFVYVKTVTDLVWLVQFGVLELHPWASRIADLEAPDHLVFDLDPGPGGGLVCHYQGRTGVTGAAGVPCLEPVSPGHRRQRAPPGGPHTADPELGAVEELCQGGIPGPCQGQPQGPDHQHGQVQTPGQNLH